MIGCQCSSGWSIPACMGNPDQTQKKRNKDYIKFGGSFWGGFQEELGGRVYIIKIPCILSFSKKKNKNKMNPPPIFRGKRTAPLQPGTTTDRHISDHLKGVSHHLILSGLPQDIQPIRREQVWPAIHCTRVKAPVKLCPQITLMTDVALNKPSRQIENTNFLPLVMVADIAGCPTGCSGCHSCSISSKCWSHVCLFVRMHSCVFLVWPVNCALNTFFRHIPERVGILLQLPYPQVHPQGFLCGPECFHFLPTPL